MEAKNYDICNENSENYNTGEGSSARNTAVAPPDDMYDGLSQEEASRLQAMTPELRNALLRLRKNIKNRRKEREQEAEAHELNKLLGVKTQQDAMQERNAIKLQAAMEEQERRNREAVRKKFLCPQGMTEAGIPRLFQNVTMDNIIRQGLPEALEYPHMRICDYIASLDKCCKSGTGLILTGPCGTLKTTFACSIMLEAFDHGIEARFELVMSMLDRLIMLEKKQQGRILPHHAEAI